MSKATVNMTNWQLYVYQERYSLSGTADKHPVLGIDSYVSHTSSLVDYIYEDDTLIYETENTIYVCPLKYMNIHPYGNIEDEYKEKLTHRADNSDCILDELIAASAKMSLNKKDKFVRYIKKLAEIGQRELEQARELDDKRRFDIIKDYSDAVYIEVSNVSSGDKLTYHLGDKFGTVMPRVNSGMFQDSILYMLYRHENDNGCSLDFRYFPMGWDDVMETYSWSDNIKQVVIKNVKSTNIEFNKETIKPGELKVFTPDTHSQGLISPDCYNGKSILFDAIMKKSDENE